MDPLIIVLLVLVALLLVYQFAVKTEDDRLDHRGRERRKKGKDW
jgi:hypothetical protein